MARLSSVGKVWESLVVLSFRGQYLFRVVSGLIVFGVGLQVAEDLLSGGRSA